MHKKYEVWFETCDPVTMRYRVARAKRRFDTKTEAEDYVEDIKRGWVKTVVDAHDTVINLGRELNIRIIRGY